MTKLSKQHFEFLINVALDSGDKEYFDSLVERQTNESFDFSTKEDQRMAALDDLTKFMETEEGVLIRNVKSILDYHSKDPYRNFDKLAENLSEAVLYSSERVDSKAEFLSKQEEERNKPEDKKEIILVESLGEDLNYNITQEMIQVYLHDDETVEEMIARLLNNKEIKGEISNEDNTDIGEEEEEQ